LVPRSGLVLVAVLAVAAVFVVLDGRWPWQAGCTIKGNVAPGTGERIYHLPGDAFHGRTRVSLWRGERWFCTEAEARAAGWRRARL
jgi:hypothetical protein